ncbi:unnamed protein product [Linum tenue]|uniref:RNI-like superfamily protein n=1 Tax=Linum tenue TaxID=586396 RepID=A0AAV0LVR8_9ROSI|nr:unnamed protein product [Linum tenue]
MEKRKPTEETVSASLKKLDLSSTASNPNSSRSISTLQSSRFRREKGRPPSLVSLCVGVLGRHLEDVIGELREISVGFPAHIKLAIVAIARRRKLLNDDLILSLVDSSWEILDISGSDVTDTCLAEVSKICSRIRAVDIRGCPRSNYTARRSLGILKPELMDLEGDSWEELDAAEIAHGAESLRWLLWPMIDKDSQETLATECPRIIVNPKPSPLGFRGLDVPIEAHADIALDDSVVKDISPTTWAVGGFAPRSISPCISGTPGIELSMAERFRLAFLDRDTRLAPKRAKNARQRQRRAEREMLMSSTNAKAIALASRATKSFHG